MDDAKNGTDIKNWVELRHNCSPFDMFTRLRHGVEQDIATLVALLSDKRPATEFKIIAESNFFAVTRQVAGEYAERSPWVQFSWNNEGIRVKNFRGASEKAVLTLNDSGECKLKLEDGKELNCWQFRKRFLEDLFFNF
ncbi:MAG TPA: hypothetical protein VFZ27_03575 [Terriglobia bacterium]|nr:hypothetical protein [Terriglobia bacterium]